MKLRKKLLNLSLAASMTLSLAACGQTESDPTPTPNGENTVTVELTDGTYTATAAGKMGDITLEVSFADGKITAVTVTEQRETEGTATPALERIPQAVVENQSVLIDTVSGATVTSEAILTAVKSCIEQAGGNVADFEKAVAKNDSVADVELESDIVIVGAGAAGLMAAYKASELGANVIVMEKGANANGSNFAVCGGPAAAETNIQAAEGATVTVEQMFEHLYDYSNTTVDAKALREVIAHSGEAINIMDDLGIEMYLISDTYGVGYRARHMIAEEGDGRTLPIVSATEKIGAKFLFETTGEKILMENGKAVGVQGTNAEGATVTVKADAVLICTGGFAANADMVKRYLGVDNLVNLGTSLTTGDGINMVLEAGGTLDRNFAVLGNEGGGSTTKIDGPIFNEYWELANDNLAFWIYGGLLVDMDGDRFINEKLVADFPLALGGEALLRQGKAYAVMSADYYEACTDGAGIMDYLGQPDNWVAGEALWYPNLPNAKEQLDIAIDEGWAYKADTLAECAEYFGLENLEATVAEYNQMCANDKDGLFGKPANFMTPVGDGPYYIFEYEPAAWSTDGGVKVDSYLRAVNVSGDAIPGLYVAGVDTGSYYAVPYYDGEGSSVGLAMGSGIYAAENMIEYINQHN